MKELKAANVIAALSLANLFFFPVWRRLIYPADPLYNVKYLPDTQEYITLIVTVIALAAIFCIGFVIAGKLGPKWVILAKLVFLVLVSFVLMILGVMILKTQFWIVPLVGRKVLMVSAVVVGLAAIGFCIWRYRQIVGYARAFVLILAPLVLFTFTQAVIHAFDGSPAPNEIVSDKKPILDVNSTGKIKSRVVWIIFDEMDYRLAFEKRPDGIALPAFDRLRGETIHADHARSPSRGTVTSVPSLMTGRNATKAETVGPNELRLTFDDTGETEKFGTQSTVFSDVRGMGGRTAVIGWYHPYCRILSDHFDECHWETFDVLTDFPADNIPEIILGDLKRVVNIFPRQIRDRITMSREYIRRHHEMMQISLRLVSDPSLDLVFVHLPVPHYPVVYDRLTDDFSGGKSYADNLVLADKMLSELRQQMEKARLWEDSAVIVSSDHQFRLRDNISASDRNLIGSKEDERVPFLLKLPNTNESIKITDPIQTLVTHDLIEMLIQSEFESPQQAAEWLKAWTPDQ